MSAFLWVEDFESGNYQEIAFALFGKAINKGLDDFPNDRVRLRKMLKPHGIILCTNYAEAARYIDKEEFKSNIDFVVLDIDLLLTGDDDDDLLFVHPMMQRWYEYTGDDASYDKAYARMKQVAGYHIFVDLVIQRGFPRERIMFCSNHGESLKSINDSFEPAKIEAPDIPKKMDPKVEAWISDGFNNSYVAFRRIIISSCEKIQDQLINDQSNQVFQLSKLPGNGAERLSGRDAVDYLETLRRIFPMTEESSDYLGKTLRLFSRTLSEPWVNIDTGKIDNGWRQSFSCVLKDVRNWTGHSQRALTSLDIADAAFLFLIALRISFHLDPDLLRSEESGLLALMDATSEPIDDHELFCKLTESYLLIERLAKESGSSSKAFRPMLRGIFDGNNQVLIVSNLKKHMYQIFWHELYGRIHSTLKFNDLLIDKRNREVKDILGLMLNSIYSKSF